MSRMELKNEIVNLCLKVALLRPNPVDETNRHGCFSDMLSRFSFYSNVLRCYSFKNFQLIAAPITHPHIPSHMGSPRKLLVPLPSLCEHHSGWTVHPFRPYAKGLVASRRVPNLLRLGRRMLVSPELRGQTAILQAGSG
jgi:hypothetical protein